MSAVERYRIFFPLGMPTSPDFPSSSTWNDCHRGLVPRDNETILMAIKVKQDTRESLKPAQGILENYICPFDESYYARICRSAVQ